MVGQPCHGMYSSIIEALRWRPRRWTSGLEAAGNGGAGVSGLAAAKSLAYRVGVSNCFSPSLVVDEADPKRLSEGEKIRALTYYLSVCKVVLTEVSTAHDEAVIKNINFAMLQANDLIELRGQQPLEPASHLWSLIECQPAPVY